MTLLKGPQKRDDIVRTYHRFGALLGIPSPSPGTKKYQKWQREVDADLDHLKQLKLVELDEYNVYRLTEQGVQEATKLEEGLQKFTRLQRSCSLLPPSHASRRQLSGMTARGR